MIDLHKKKKEIENRLDAINEELENLFEERDKLEAQLELVDEFIEEETATETVERVI